MLRLEAESENWYEVIVNEETGLTKYIWKDDPVLGKDSWEGYILLAAFITLDKEKNPLRDTPNGELSKEELPKEQKYFMPEKIEDEWMKVGTGWSDYVEKPIGGWIRWRDGNFLANGFKSPPVKLRLVFISIRRLTTAPESAV